VETAISRVTGYFASAGRPFSWWLGPADRPADLGRALLDAGFTAAESEVAMAADLEFLAAGDPAPAGLRIERATTAAPEPDFGQVCAANWTRPTAGAPLLPDRRAAAARGCPIRLYVGYLGRSRWRRRADGERGRWASTTSPRSRPTGGRDSAPPSPCGRCRRAGGRACAGGAPGVGAGTGVYARLGFKETGWYTEYQLPRGEGRKRVRTCSRSRSADAAAARPASRRSPAVSSSAASVLRRPQVQRRD
jgi:hypothetical protein